MVVGWWWSGGATHERDAGAVVGLGLEGHDVGVVPELPPHLLHHLHQQHHEKQPSMPETVCQPGKDGMNGVAIDGDRLPPAPPATHPPACPSALPPPRCSLTSPAALATAATLSPTNQKTIMVPMSPPMSTSGTAMSTVRKGLPLN